MPFNGQECLVARDEVEGDFMLRKGDTFYERKVIEALSQADQSDCLVLTEESGNGDEAFVETYKGFVTKITKDVHQIAHYEGEMLGLMRISGATFQKMLALWDVSSNLYLNYEYVFMDVTSPLDRPYLYFKNLIWGDVDSQEDFRKLKYYIYPRLRRKENPFDYTNLFWDHIVVEIYRSLDIQVRRFDQMFEIDTEEELRTLEKYLKV